MRCVYISETVSFSRSPRLKKFKRLHIARLGGGGGSTRNAGLDAFSAPIQIQCSYEIPPTGSSASAFHHWEFALHGSEEGWGGGTE